MLNRWDPFSDISRLQADLGRFFPEGRGVSISPAVDIFEEEDSIVLNAEMPGVKSEDIDIQVENNVLTLTATRKLENEDRREGYRRIERSYGSFTRSFALPRTVDAEQIEANLEDGVLRLRLPKRAAALSRRIEVKNGQA